MDAASKKKVRSSDSHIHDDIAFSILSKLPFKSLTRFTCAKKSWSLLFQNPNFMNTLRKNHENKAETRLLIKEHLPGFTIQQSLSILSGERFEIRANLEWPLPLQQQGENANANANAKPFHFTHPIIILGSASVNGTLCLYQGLTTVLWNPSTSEFKIIPPSFKPKEKIEFTLPPHGFGYDCVTDDYKVIRKVRYPFQFEGDDWVCLPDKDDPFWETGVHHLDLIHDFWEEKGLIVKLYDYDPCWEIYSLRSDSWRKLDGFDDMPDYFPGITSMVNFNGFCHWLTQGPDNDIVSFNFSKETFFATTLPCDVKHRSHMFALVELNESLSVIYNYDRTPDFHIWVLGEVGVKESWTKLFIVGSYNCSIVCPISVGNKNRIFFKKEDSELGWFDLSTQRVEVIGVNGESFCSHMVIYKENPLPFPRNE